MKFKTQRTSQFCALGILAPLFMKSKQLVNVLIKMLGLSVCLYAIPSCITGILYGLTTMMASKPDIVFLRVFSSAVGAAVQAIIGIVIICQSQKIAGWMFKNDDE
jgi:hypothetical protein